MKRCINCSAFLPENEQTICFVCGTVQSIAKENIAANNKNSTNNTAQNAPTNGAHAAPPQDESTGDFDAVSDFKVGNYDDLSHDTLNEPPVQNAPRGHSTSAKNQQNSTRPNTAPQNLQSSTQFIIANKAGKPKSDKASLQAGLGHASAHAEQYGETAKKNGPAFKVLIAVFTLLFLLLAGASAVTVVMYDKYNLGNTLSQIETALIAADIGTLENFIVGDGVEITDDGLTALCREFDTPEEALSLVTHLSGTTREDYTPPELYSSLEMISEDVFFGYKEYKLQVKPVSLMLTANVETVALTANSVPVMGQSVEGGTLYTDIMPGLYTFTATGQTLIGQSVQGVPTDISLLDANAAVTFDGALPLGDVSVAGCISDEAIISVNGLEVVQRPVNQVVTLPQLLVGSNISMSYTSPHGATVTASVKYTDVGITQLAFVGHEIKGQIPTQEELTTIATTFYTAFFDASNTKDAAKLALLTEEFKLLLTEQINTQADTGTLSSLVLANADGINTQYLFIENGVPAVLFNAEIDFNLLSATDSEKAPEPQKTYVTIEIVNDAAGNWVVNNVALNSVENHVAGTLSPTLTAPQ